jgi:sugar phosphate isomerase/epimerase
MGIAEFTFRHRMQLDRERRVPEPITDPVHFLEFARRLGAGGIQTSLAALDADRAAELRRRADAYGMWVEGSEGLPRRKEDVDRFEAAILAVRAAGATHVRSVLLGGRRYETFDSEEQWARFVADSRARLELARPVLERHGVVLAFENHKDFRVPEFLPFLKALGSDRFAACPDFSNNFTLLEDNHEVVEALAPVAAMAHVKDMAVAPADDGFLAADVPFGDGFHDLARMTGALRRANPKIRLSLEMSARDALRVPCLSPRYWATMRDVPGADLARTLRVVRDRAFPEEKLPRVNHLPLEERARIEEANVRRCLAYAAQKLGL